MLKKSKHKEISLINSNEKFSDMREKSAKIETQTVLFIRKSRVQSCKIVSGQLSKLAALPDTKF